MTPGETASCLAMQVSPSRLTQAGRFKRMPDALAICPWRSHSDGRRAAAIITVYVLTNRERALRAERLRVGGVGARLKVAVFRMPKAASKDATLCNRGRRVF